MRIGYFTNTYPRATDTFIQREVMGLRSRGFDVRTFSVRSTGEDHDVGLEVVAEKRGTFYLLPVNPLVLIVDTITLLLRSPGAWASTAVLAWKTARPGVRGRIWQLFYFLEAVVLARELRRQRIVHLHNHLGDASGTVAMLASKLCGVGYSITIHGPHIFFDPTHWALAEKLRSSRFITCISRYCQSQMMLFSDRADWSRLEIVHCGVDIDRYRPISVREKARKLLYTGRLSAEKGLPVLFESLKCLKGKGYDFELTLVGDGPYRADLVVLANQIGIAERIVFAGYASQDEVRTYLEQSDMFILPSFAEGVPVSLMEAMACGVPVIATYVGGVAELVDSEQTGLMVPPADAEALADAIARYLDDHALRDRVSRQGRVKVVAEFNLKIELDKLADLFRSYTKEGWRD